MSERKVSTDALETLGMIHPHQQYRDAIHLAVEPVVAGERLSPGEHVFLRDGKAYGNTGATNNPPLLGIVDPFLEDKVKPGQQFWLVIYPRKITSLRHVWSHPQLSDDAGAPVLTDPIAISRKWIEDFAAGVPLDYTTVMDGAAEYVRDRERGGYGEYLCFGGLREGECVPEEFWPHYERVTGKAVPDEHRGSFFTCSC